MLSQNSQNGHLDDILKKGMRIQIGDDKSIRIWEGPWFKDNQGYATNGALRNFAYQGQAHCL